ncbi:hypothetical protein [Lysobacter terrae]
MNNVHPRTTQWILERWPAIRARGLVRFLLVRGVLTWGGIVAIAMAALVTFKLGIDHPRLPLLLAIDALLSGISGAAWAAWTWWASERIYLSLTSDRNP